MKTDAIKWRDVPIGSTVILRGAPWTLVSIEKVEGGLAVAVKSKGQTARTTVEKKAKVDVVRAVDLSDIIRDIEAKAEKIAARRPAYDPNLAHEPKKKPDFETDEAGWYVAPKKDTAEAAVREILGGELVGVQLGEDEAYICPLVDVATISAHLFVFHGFGPVDVRKEGGFAEALAIHTAEHAPGHAEPSTPHFHDADRPKVIIGPRFR